MKKLLMMIGAAAAVAVGANAGTVTIDGVTWTYQAGSVLADGTTAATLGDGSSACIATSTAVDAANIPWTFTDNGTDYTVTTIAASAFNECSKLSGTLTIPSAVTSMGTKAFYKCSKLSKIASLGGVTSLTEEAFRYDSGLAGSDYPDMSRITRIAKNVFNSCAMGGTVRLDSLTGSSNCDSAFNGAAITNVVFPRRAINLSGNYMFQNCSNLTGVYFPGPDTGTSEAKIRRSDCFSGCTSLKVFLAGPLTRLSDSYGKTDETMFTNVSGCRMFVPNGTNWNIEYGLGAYEESNTIFYYGAGRDLDMSFDNDNKTVTATPATAPSRTCWRRLLR